MYINYIPLGSVVLLKGGFQKLVIIARALNVKNGDKMFFFDYGAIPYPNGLVSDQVAYFNHENISKIVFEGFRDVDDENMIENINRYLSEHPEIEKGTTESWNAIDE